MKKLVLLSALLLGIFLVSCGDDDNPVEPAPNNNPEGKLYVLNQGDSTMFIYNTKTRARIDSVHTVVRNPHYIEFAPNGLNYYITTLESSGHVAKFETATNNFIDSSAVIADVQPAAIAITADNQFGYLCNFSAPGSASRMQKMDLNTMQIVDSLQGGAFCHDLKITSDGSVVIMTNRDSDNLTLAYPDADTVYFVDIDPDSTYVTTVPSKYGPFGVVVDHNDSLAYVSCMNADQVRVLDIAARTIVDSVDIPIVPGGTISGPTLLAVTPDNAHVFLTTRDGNSIVAFETSTMTVVADIPVSATQPFGIDVSADGSQVYVACVNLGQPNGMVYIIDVATFSKIDSIVVGTQSFGLKYREN